MNSILFVYLKKDKNRLFYAGAEINSIVLRKLMKNAGVEQNQYFSRQLSNVYDIVDDIVSEYMDYVCFVVDNDNLEFTMQLEHTLSDSDEETNVVYLSLDSNLSLEDKKIFQLADAIESFNELLECNMEHDLVSLKGFYLDRLVPISESDFGIPISCYVKLFQKYYFADVETILTELEFVHKHSVGNSKIYLVAENIKEYKEQKKLNQALEKLQYIDKLELVIAESERKNNHLTAISCITLDKTLGYTALVNGLFGFLSGYYITEDANEYTRHILVESKDLKEDLFKNLADKNYANSAIYVFDDEKPLLKEDVKQISDETDFLFTNYLHIDDLSIENVPVTINGQKNAWNYNKTSYSSYTHHEEEYFVEINTKEDFNMFLNDIREYEETGKITQPRCWEPMIINGCRFNDSVYCSLCKLPRMKIENNKVLPCFDSPQSLGSVDQMYFELRKKTYLEMDRVEKSRKCSECKASEYCSKCAMLPEFLCEEDYCQAMSSDFSPIDFSKKMLCVKYLFRSTVVEKLKSVKLDDVHFMTKHNSNEFDCNDLGKVNYLNDHTLFFDVPNQSKYVLFCFVTKKVLSVNPDMYKMCELFFRGLDVQAMITYLGNVKGLTEEESKEAIDGTFSILKKYGFIRNGVSL